MLSNSQKLTAFMVAKVFKRVFQIGFLLGCFASAFAWMAGWRPSIASVESLSAQSPVACLFRYFTEWECPGCGLTRAVIAFFSCDISLSFYFHPLGPIVGFLICYLFVLSFRKDFCGAPQNWVNHKHSWSFLLILIAWGILRN